MYWGWDPAGSDGGDETRGLRSGGPLLLDGTCLL